MGMENERMMGEKPLTDEKENLPDLNCFEESHAVSEYMKDVECEICMYTDHCDGWRYAPFCMANI